MLNKIVILVIFQSSARNNTKIAIPTLQGPRRLPKLHPINFVKILMLRLINFWVHFCCSNRSKLGPRPMICGVLSQVSKSNGRHQKFSITIALFSLKFTAEFLVGLSNVKDSFFTRYLLDASFRSYPPWQSVHP